MPRTPGNTLALIADLLARAEGGTTQAERDLALSRAQKEAARHGIDLAEAAYERARRGVPMEPEERRIVIGERGAAGLKTLSEFFVRICQVNDIHCLISTSGDTVFAHGMATDIDTAEMLYASLVVQNDVACEEWLATGEYRRQAAGARVWSPARGRYVPAKPHRGVARRNFTRGFVVRVVELLHEAKAQAGEEAEREARASGRPDAVTTTALALRAKSAAVESFHRDVLRERGIRSSWRGDRAADRSIDPSAWRAGHTAGGRADLDRRGTRGLPGGGAPRR